MSKLKEAIFALVTIASVAVGGLGCISVVETYLPKYTFFIGVPMMIYVWVLGGYGATVIEKKLKNK